MAFINLINFSHTLPFCFGVAYFRLSTVEDEEIHSQRGHFGIDSPTARD